MSYISAAKIYCRFYDTILLNEIDGLEGSVTGSFPKIISGKYDNALEMTTDSYVAWYSSLNITNKFTVAFWLKSKNPGMAKDNLDAMTPVLMPLVSVSNFVFDPGTGVTSMVDDQFVVWEETNEDGTNVLKVWLNGATTATVTTDAYAASVWHHFTIVYNQGDIKVYSGVQQMSLTTTGTLPTSLDSSVALLSVNKGVAGESYNILNNTGVIDELVVLNSDLLTLSAIEKMINLGAPYAIDSAYTPYEEIDQAVLFDDKTTIKVNAVNTDGNTIYLARSDGKILKDHRNLWQTRRNFSDETEESAIKQIVGSSGYTISSGVLTVTSAVIKI